MAQTQKVQPSTALTFGRHIVGMALFALVNPLIYYSDSSVTRWFSNWAFPVTFAFAVYGLYALFFTERAKAAWPKSFFTLAWVLVVLVTVEPYISNFNERLSRSTAGRPQPQPVEQTDWERGKMTPPQSEIEEALAKAPAHVPSPARPDAASEVEEFLANAPLSVKDAENWTQENTGSSENGPWLSQAPAGVRFCRMHDRSIVLLFPPGMKPTSKKANVFCATDSVATPSELGFTYEEAVGKEAATGKPDGQ